MALNAGTELGPYKIVGLIGAGGMGEVYRASDSRLQRDVAIKVLPLTFSADADRLRRFQQEARAASGLNHPNIVTIYDTGIHAGAPYIVSELLEGSSLRQRLGSPLSTKRTIDYASQIAQGLAAAHEKGIVHRDLKPENIFITKDGRVKILDFGLAKLIGPELNESQVSVAATLSHRTEPGVVLGTVAYMSPEQVRGETVDLRSDIFALGTIVYEMLSGTRPFTGNSGVEVMHAILKDDPPELDHPGKNISPGLNRIIQRCMEKDPVQRFQSARDLTFALEAVSGTSESRTVEAPLSWPISIPKQLFFVLAIIGMLGSITLALLYFNEKIHEPPGLSSSILLAPGFDAMGLALSPDGKQIAFNSANRKGEVYLCVRSLDSFNIRQLAPSTYFPFAPMWSPDGRYIAFFHGGKLKKILVSGGSTQSICDAPEQRGGAWGPNNLIIFSPKSQDALYRVSANGGTPTAATHLNISKGHVSHRWPQFLPDGEHFLFYVQAHGSEKGIYVGSLKSPEIKKILDAESMAFYAAKRIWFIREGNLMAQPFDYKHLRLLQQPTVMAEHVGYVRVLRFSDFSVAENGTIAYRSADQPLLHTTSHWVDRTGKEIEEVLELRDIYDKARFSSDSKKIGFSKINTDTQEADLWIYDVSRKNMIRFTFDPSDYYGPVWSPDDRWIAFCTERKRTTETYKRSTTSSEEQLLFYSPGNVTLADDWSPDGRFIIIEERTQKTGWDLLVLSADGKTKPHFFLQTAFSETSARFSPDGKWVAFASDQSGVTEVYLRSFEHPSAGEWKVSVSGGQIPQWRQDGKELYYQAGQTIMAVDITPGDSFQAGVPHRLFTLPTGVEGWLPQPDGQRFFLTIAAGEQNLRGSISIIWNPQAAP